MKRLRGFSTEVVSLAVVVESVGGGDSALGWVGV